MEEVRLISWNCAGLRKKEGRFWEYLRRFDDIALTETWMEGREGEIEGVMRKLRGYEIEIKKARREGSRGRARGVMLMAVKKKVGEWEEKWNHEGKGEVLGGVIKIVGKRIKIVLTYMREERQKHLEEIKGGVGGTRVTEGVKG